MIRKIYAVNALTILLAFILAFPCQSLAYNKSWDQGHQSTKPDDGDEGCENEDECGPKECSPDSTACSVYVKTGRLEETLIDLSVPGIGPSLTIVRTYQSLDWANSLFGRHWVFNFGRRIAILRSNEGDKRVLVHRQGGEINSFKEHEDGTLELLNSYGVPYELMKNPDGTYIIAERNGTVHHINADGKIRSIYDKNGNQLLFEYDSVGCLSRITNASGNYMDFQLGPNGKIASISDNLGRTFTYSYDTNANLTSSTDPMGNTTQYAYDSENRLTQIIDPRGNTVFSVTYDNSQPPRIATFAEKGETWTFTYYDGYTVKSDSSGNTWTYYYNDLGLAERVIDPLGNVTQKQHNRVTSTSMDWEDDANGNRTTYTHDADGNITSKTDPLGNTWTYTYIAGTDRVETETNPLGVVTRYEYDGNGNRTRIVRDSGGPLENATTYSYDSEGNLTSVTGPLGNTTTYEYDADGNLIRITDPLGNVTTYTYDNRGNRITETNALGNTTTYAYDLMNRLISVTDALGNTTTYAYDGNGNQVSMTDALGNTTVFVYDAYNRLVQVTDPLGNTMSYTYDTNDTTLTMTDGNGNVTAYQYDLLGRRIRITDPLGNQTNFVYDAGDNLVSLTDAKGNTTTHTYDANKRIIQKSYPGGATYAYTYNAIGNKATETNPNGDTTTFAYDRLNGLITKTYQDGSTSGYTYDALGRVLTGTNADSTLSYSYDAVSRVTQSTLNSKTVSYTYDAVGNRISMVTPEGETIQYNYNATNQMLRMQLSNNKGIDYTYDSLLRITRKDYSGGSYSTYTFDAAGRLTQLRHLKSDNSAIYEQANTFDNVGNITAKTTGLGNTTYTYDAIYQLLSTDHPTLPDETFTYDPVCNRLTSTDYSNWSYNNRNQLTGYNGVSFAYDGNGNTISKTDASGTTTYISDYENRLTRIDFSGGGYATYKYDVYGRRIEKNVDGSVTRYIYDGTSLLAEYDSSGNLVRNYFCGFGDTNPSILCENSHIYYFHHDHLSTPQKVTDETGNVEWEALYKSFGEANITLENVANNFRFPGQYYDHKAGLNYNLSRYYDYRIGRYLSSDKLVPAPNLYLYSYNNPIRYSDPMGEKPEYCLEDYCPGGEWINTFGGVGGGFVGYLEGGVMTAQCVNKPTLTRGEGYFCIGVGVVAGISAFSGPGVTTGAYRASDLTGWLFGGTLEGGVGVGAGVVALTNGKVSFIAPFISTGEEVGGAFVACYSWFID